MLLQMKCPAGGRPQKDLIFKVDPDDSILCYRAGWINCPSCGREVSVSVDRHELDIFMASSYNTVSKKPHFDFKGKLSGLLRRVASDIDNRGEGKKLRQLPNGGYVRT